MTDEERIARANERYAAAMHGVQTAVMYEIGAMPREAAADPKHLRVGINSALVNDLAVAELLIDKGVFTSVEYHEAVAAAAERELARFHAKHRPFTFS